MENTSNGQDTFLYDAFISYSSVDKIWVSELARRLKKANLKIWIDENLECGDSIPDSIYSAIEKSRRFIFVISKHSVNAAFPISELQSVLFGDPLNKKGRLIPLRIDSVKAPAFLAAFANIDITKSHTWFETLVRSCRCGIEAQFAKIFILDDHPIVIEGIKRVVNEQEDMQMVGDCEDARLGLRQIAELKPDVVLLDIVLRDCCGVDLIKKIRAISATTQVLVYSMMEDDKYAERCLRAGAMGYLMKGEGGARVLQGLRQILSGGFCFSANLIGSIVSGGGPRSGSRGEPGRLLSDRQLKVFEAVGRGFDSHEIAEQLSLNAKTVDAHKANIRQKLGLTSARELLMEAVRWVEK